jgi:hypothetical protein
MKKNETSVKEKNVEIMTEKEKHLNETNTFHRH